MLQAVKTKTLAGGGPWEGTVYRDTEAGLPLMLVHGFPADGSLWDHQISALSGRFRLLVPDLPGSGASPEKTPLSIADMAEVLKAILDQEHIPACVVIGHSMGGYATLAFAERYPSRLKGYGLFHATAFADSPEKKAGRSRSMELMRRYGGATFLRQMMPTLFSAAFRKAHPEVLQSLVDRAEKAPSGALVGYYDAMRNRPDRTEILRQTPVPVLFVIGKEDTAAPPADVLKQVSLPSVSQVYLWEAVAHMSMLEKPELATEALEAFVTFCERYPLFL